MGPAGPKPRSFTTDAAAEGVTANPIMKDIMNMTTIAMIHTGSLCFFPKFFTLSEWMGRAREDVKVTGMDANVPMLSLFMINLGRKEGRWERRECGITLGHEALS
jgi:hypothetical protein